MSSLTFHVLYISEQLYIFLLHVYCMCVFCGDYRDGHSVKFEIHWVHMTSQQYIVEDVRLRNAFYFSVTSLSLVAYAHPSINIPVSTSAVLVITSCVFCID